MIIVIVITTLVSMEKDSIIKAIDIRFSDDDLKKLAVLIKPDTHGRLKYCAKVQNHPYPARQLVVEMLRREGNVMPEIVTCQAMQILRALGFEITES